MSVVHIDVTPDPAHVRVVRLVAVSLARLNGISEEAVEDVRLAVGEACGRAVAAQARVDLETPVVVDFAGDTGLTVTVSDAVPLPAASGAAAVALLDGDGAGDGVGDRGDDGLGTDAGLSRRLAHLEAAPEVMALLEGLAEAVTVHTGRSGTAVSLHWSSGA
jgi:hypothetical protein